MEVVILRVFAVIALAGREAVDALFQDGVFAVPNGEAEDQELIAVADGGQAVFAPAIGLAPRHVMREEVPGCAIRAVVLADRSPGTLAYIGAPAAPQKLSVSLKQPAPFFGLSRGRNFNRRDLLDRALFRRRRLICASGHSSSPSAVALLES